MGPWSVGPHPGGPLARLHAPGTRPRPVRAVAAATLVTVLCLAACGGAATPSVAAAPTYEIRAATVGSVGQVLVDGPGYTLYLFQPDQQAAPTCTGTCATVWPPLILPAGVAAPTAGNGVQASLLGTTRRPDGSVQVTYNGWPLYRWNGDTVPGQDTGQGLDNLGGLWYVVSPAGGAVH